MSNDPGRIDGLGAPLGSAERALMDQFIRDRGLDPNQLDALPAEEREKLRREAALYASAKLEEIDAEARLVHKFHEAGGSSHTAGD